MPDVCVCVCVCVHTHMVALCFHCKICVLLCKSKGWLVCTNYKALLWLITKSLPSTWLFLPLWPGGERLPVSCLTQAVTAHHWTHCSGPRWDWKLVLDTRNCRSSHSDQILERLYLGSKEKRIFISGNKKRLNQCLQCSARRCLCP